MDYNGAVHFAQTWGVALLVGVFAISVIYALWPSNRDTFNRLAQTPLADEDEDG